jgi:hypothetical protein
MKSFSRLSLLGSGLGLVLLTAVSPSFATVIGTLSPVQVGPATNLGYLATPLTAVQSVSGLEVTPATLDTSVAPTFGAEPAFGISLDSFSAPELGAVPLVSSPIILTATSVGSLSVQSITGSVTSGSVVNDVVSSFNVASTETPGELTQLPTYNTPYSGAFVSTVPEPRSISLVVLAGLLMGLVLKRRKSEALKNEA